MRVCRNHQEDEVTPLIWTFAFPGAEYWCPRCGYVSGMLGAGERVDDTPELQKLHDTYKKKSKKFLRAKSILVCAKTKYRGKWTEPKDLPERSKTYWRNRAKEWEYLA